MKKYDKQDQKALVAFAADCAERVLVFFENEYPDDDRPREAIEVCREWVRTGVFKMADIRAASLSAHSAARNAKKNSAACFAARAAGQAVATAHVAQHVFGAVYYALKAIAVADPVNAEPNVFRELYWQIRHFPENLRQELVSRVIIDKTRTGIKIKIIKDKDF